MADRISEIKNMIEMLGEMLETELKSQRSEIQILKDRLEMLSAVKEAPKIVLPPPDLENIPESIFEQKPRVETFSFDKDDDDSFEIRKAPEPTEEKVSILGDLFEEETPIGEYNPDEKPSWMIDLPGPAVDDVSKAMSLNDRLFFINELFADDEEQFELTLERINETFSFKEVVNDLRSAFPEWMENSDAVYRFYMAVRRKF